jgi:hypothetical protein
LVGDVRDMQPENDKPDAVDWKKRAGVQRRGLGTANWLRLFRMPKTLTPEHTGYTKENPAY